MLCAIPLCFIVTCKAPGTLCEGRMTTKYVLYIYDVGGIE